MHNIFYPFKWVNVMRSALWSPGLVKGLYKYMPFTIHHVFGYGKLSSAQKFKCITTFTLLYGLGLWPGLMNRLRKVEHFDSHCLHCPLEVGNWNSCSWVFAWDFVLSNASHILAYCKGPISITKQKLITRDYAVCLGVLGWLCGIYIGIHQWQWCSIGLWGV